MDSSSECYDEVQAKLSLFLIRHCVTNKCNAVDYVFPSIVILVTNKRWINCPGRFNLAGSALPPLTHMTTEQEAQGGFHSWSGRFGGQKYPLILPGMKPGPLSRPSLTAQDVPTKV